jgi:RecA/RadA recombinase
MRNDLTHAEKKKKIKSATKKFIDKYKLDKNPNVHIGIMSEDPTIGVIDQFKTGNVAIDILTGGYFKGVANVIYGPPGVGKSTLMRDLVKYTQEEHDAFSLYMNQEKTMDRTYWENAGVNMDMLQVAEFENTEQSLDMCNKCATGENPVDILMIDTLQALSPESELTKAGDTKSVASNTIGLIPRLYSQFFRMYTSINTGLSLILVSQVRTSGIGGVGLPFDGMTGGNAIKHYCNLILQMKKSESASAWPYAVTSLPPHSYVVNFKIDKIKGAHRYKGLKLTGYFVKGKFDRRFNIIAIGKELGVHDGKSFSYPDPEDNNKMLEYTSRGLNEMINGIKSIPDEAVDYMYTLLEPAFLKKANEEMDVLLESDDDIDLSIINDEE